MVLWVKQIVTANRAKPGKNWGHLENDLIFNPFESMT